MNIVYELDEAAASQEKTGVWGASLLRDEFAEYISQAESDDDWLAAHPSKITWIKDLVPFDEDEDQPLVHRLVESFESVTGRRPAIDRMVAWADACWPSSYSHIPTILYGPAAHTAPHTDTEYTELDALIRCTQVLGVFLLRQLKA